MTRPSYATILNAAAADRIADSVDLTPRILAALEGQKIRPARSKLHPAAILLLAVLAALALSTVAYAVYRWIGDSGLQSAHDAGLVTELDVPAQPTLLPTNTPARTQQTVTSVALSQTIDDMTLILDWVYLDENRLVLGMQYAGLPEGASLGSPQVIFKGVAAVRAQGWSLVAGENQAKYVSYQTIRTAGAREAVDLRIDIPLVRVTNGEQVSLAGFHYEVKGVPITRNQIVSIQQTSAFRRNEIEMRFKSVRITPNLTEMVACTDLPDPTDLSWSLQRATVQFGNDPELDFQSLESWVETDGDHCMKIGFPSGNSADAYHLVFRLGELATDGRLLPGPWEFSVDLPHANAIPGLVEPPPLPTPAPLDAQTVDEVTVTLNWVFADAKRVAFGYTITGLPDVPDAVYLGGRLDVRNNLGIAMSGSGLGGSMARRVEGNPGTITGTWSTVLQEPIPAEQIGLTIDLTLDDSTGYDWNNILAQFDISPEATPYPPGVFPPALPDRLIGTFHFEAEVPVYPMLVVEPEQTVVANGIAMRLVRGDITPSYAGLTLCYPKPSDKDWMIGQASSLRAGNYTASIQMYELLLDGNDTEPLPETRLPAIQPGERCVRLHFLLGRSDPDLALTLTVSHLEQSVPEVIPDAEIRAALEILRAEGIEMDYTTAEFSSGGGGGPLFTKLPDGMSAAQAYERFLNALGYLHPGPWVFNLDLH